MNSVSGHQPLLNQSITISVLFISFPAGFIRWAITFGSLAADPSLQVAKKWTWHAQRMQGALQTQPAQKFNMTA